MAERTPSDVSELLSLPLASSGLEVELDMCRSSC